MKKLLILPLLLLSLSLGATKIYVATTGNDGTGDGTSGNPYLTIATGISNASAGDTVFIVAGTYNITNEITVPVGINIMGEGATSIISCNYVSPAFSSGLNHGQFLLGSVAENTAGNQSISHLYFDGNDLTSTNAIMVKNRGLVKVHDCDFYDFYWNAVTFTNAPNVITPPTTRAYGNEFYNNYAYNCTDSAGSWRSNGILGVIGQDYILIHDNEFYGNTRAEGYNGDIVSFSGQGFNKRVKYYRNKSWKPDRDGNTWNFHLEIFNCYGGNEIYDNEFYGGDCIIDITGMYENTAGDQGYSYKIYNNYFTGTPVSTYHGKTAIDIEGELNEDIYIYNNRFYNIVKAVHFTDNTYRPSTTRRVYIYYNLMYDLGWDNAAAYANDLEILNYDAASLHEDIFIYNNVIVADATHMAMKINPVGTINNLQIKNNIILNHTNGAFLLIDNDGTIDSLHITNNILYGNSNSNLPLIQTEGTMTNYVCSGNVNANPLFKSNETFRLRPTSPAIDAGIDVGLTTDYHGHRVPQNGTPDIGACEVGNYVLFYNGKQLY